MDKIETYFSGEYVRNKDGLRAAQKETNEASWKAYYENVGKAADEAISQEVVVPPESKKKSILYYPLMGMILLLIFGALISLCMVLIDRFVSPF